MSELYYTAPTDEQFEELKREAMALWSTMGDEPSYAEEKIGRIKDIGNIKDNFMYMVAMFDIHNQELLAGRLSEETRNAVRERMIDGGQPEHLIAF
tara:strand:+ start:5574 stop:5861 length:288 start_codon:yes stop_codon:yes gene_type:complete